MNNKTGSSRLRLEDVALFGNVPALAHLRNRSPPLYVGLDCSGKLTAEDSDAPWLSDKV